MYDRREGERGEDGTQRRSVESDAMEMAEKVAVEVADKEVVALEVEVADDVVLQLKTHLEISDTLEAALADERVAGVVAVDELVSEILLHDALYSRHVAMGEAYLAVAEILADEALELVDGERRIVFQQRDVLAHALHAFAEQLGVAGRYAAHHVLHAGVVEHGAVDDAAAGDVVEGVAGHFPAVDEDVVTAGSLRIDTQLAEHEGYHADVAVEGVADLLVLRDIAEHDVAHVGIDAAAATLAAIGLYAMCAAVVEVHLVLYELVAPEDDGGVDLPHEEAVFFVYRARNILFHGKIEGQDVHLGRRQGDVFHVVSVDGLRGFEVQRLPLSLSR